MLAYLPRLLSALAVLFVAAPLAAAPPTELTERAAVVGQPATIAIEPGAVTLAGPRSMQQLIVVGRYADQSSRDLTAFAEFRCEPAGLIEIRDGFGRPRH